MVPEEQMELYLAEAWNNENYERQIVSWIVMREQSEPMVPRTTQMTMIHSTSLS
jgi:hypothetical protein